VTVKFGGELWWSRSKQRFLSVTHHISEKVRGTGLVTMMALLQILLPDD